MKGLKRLWAPDDNTIYVEIGANATVINFTSEEQQEKVLTSGPWRCDDWVILVSECRADDVLEGLQLWNYNCWVMGAHLQCTGRQYV